MACSTCTTVREGRHDAFDPPCHGRRGRHNPAGRGRRPETVGRRRVTADRCDEPARRYPREPRRARRWKQIKDAKLSPSELPICMSTVASTFVIMTTPKGAAHASAASPGRVCCSRRLRRARDQNSAGALWWATGGAISWRGRRWGAKLSCSTYRIASAIAARRDRRRSRSYERRPTGFCRCCRTDPRTVLPPPRRRFRPRWRPARPGAIE